MILRTFNNIGKALANLNPNGVRAAAERIVIIGLTGGQGERLAAMESFLAPPDLILEKRVNALRHIYRTDIPGGPAEFDVEIQDEILPPRRGVFDFRFSAPTLTIQRILRERLGFQGLVLTDDLEMNAVGCKYDPVEATIRTLKAGADMALVGRNLVGEVDVEDLLKGLQKAVASGQLSKERVAASFGRVIAFKEKWIPTSWEPPFPWGPSAAAHRLASRLWGEAESSVTMGKA